MRALVPVAVMAILVPSFAYEAVAQNPLNSSVRASELRPVVRQFGGWEAASADKSAVEPASGPQAREAQRAFYQQQQSFSDTLPSFPSSGFKAGPNASTAAVLPDLPALPAGQQKVFPSSPPPQVNPPTQQLYPSNQQPTGTYPEQIPQQRAIPAQTVGNDMQQQDLRNIQGRSAATTNPPMPAGSLRNQQNFTTGAPFVSPPPGMGRYPTSPYQGPRYQTTAFQRNAPLAAQTVAVQSGGLSAPQGMGDLADMRPSLPQNQNVMGVYPTAFQQCAPGANFPGTGGVPGAYVPPTYTPNLTPNLYSANNSGYSPLFSLGQENYNVLLGRGLIGQPTVYVPGQPFRNFFRYISP